MESFPLSFVRQENPRSTGNNLGSRSDSFPRQCPTKQSSDAKTDANSDASASVHNKFYFRINNKENSNMIQVLSSANSIWRGDDWSEIQFRVHLHSSFINLNRQRTSPLILAASIEHEKTGQIWGNTSADNRVHIKFARNCLKDESYALVDADPYHDVSVVLHSTVFSAEESFVLRVDLDQKEQTADMDAFLFGCSQSIR